jgi:hypothetical protein
MLRKRDLVIATERALSAGSTRRRDLFVAPIRSSEHSGGSSLLSEQGDSFFVEGDEEVSAKPVSLVRDYAISEVAPGSKGL